MSNKNKTRRQSPVAASLATDSPVAASPGEAEATPAKRPRFAVLCPNPDYSGIHPQGLRFFSGRAITEDAALADVYEGLGYEVADADATVEEAEERPQ